MHASLKNIQLMNVVIVQLYLPGSLSDVEFLSHTDCKPKGADLLALPLFVSICISIMLLSRVWRVRSSCVWCAGWRSLPQCPWSPVLDGCKGWAECQQVWLACPLTSVWTGLLIMRKCARGGVCHLLPSPPPGGCQSYTQTSHPGARQAKRLGRRPRLKVFTWEPPQITLKFRSSLKLFFFFSTWHRKTVLK